MTFGYLVRRLLAVILVLFVVTFAVFAITMILGINLLITFAILKAPLSREFDFQEEFLGTN